MILQIFAKYFQDTLYLGGISVEGQAIELATTVDESFQRDKGDGILGLAFGPLNSVTPSQVNTPVDNMIEQRDIPEVNQLCRTGALTLLGKSTFHL